MRNMNDLVRQAGVMQNKIAKMQQEIKMVFRNENFSRTSIFDFKIREILISGFVK